MGVTTEIAVTNEVDTILAERGFIEPKQIRSVVLDNVLVDTGATQLCLPEEIISQLALTQAGQIEVKAATGTKEVRVFKNLTLAVAGREGRFDCWELPALELPLLGWFPLEGLGLKQIAT